MSLRLIIVTICFNNLEEVIRTCESVDGQSRLPNEHWVINGSTTPAIEGWLNKGGRQPYRHVVNEPDLGIADAFNKGIRNAGDGYIQLLNSGDLLFDSNILQRIEDFIRAADPMDWISGKIQLSRGEIVGTAFDASKLNHGMRWVAHPSWWVKKEVYLRVGEYDLRYKVAMDYDMLCRLQGFNYSFYGFPAVIFDLSGISSSSISNGQSETRLIYQRRFGHSWQLFFRQKWALMSLMIQRQTIGQELVRMYRSVKSRLQKT